ncbi:MAG: peptide deformylase [Opitutae bacterium]|jgi:peptide deformylase|nr:peptide deformylase [Opitutae bacterium]
MALNISMYGESILTQKGKKITDFSNDLKKLYQDMLDTMYREEGIGLAAQQVGLALQFCVIDVPSHPEFPITCVLDGNSISPQLLMPMVLINPTIKFLPSDEYYYEEGCLSFPEIKADVARPELIIVQYQDIDGSTHNLECDGLLGRCIQHEVDHLNGILFIDRMEKDAYTEIKRDIQALKKQTQAMIKQKRNNLKKPRGNSE